MLSILKLILLYYRAEGWRPFLLENGCLYQYLPQVRKIGLFLVGQSDYEQHVHDKAKRLPMVCFIWHIFLDFLQASVCQQPKLLDKPHAFLFGWNKCQGLHKSYNNSQRHQTEHFFSLLLVMKRPPDASALVYWKRGFQRQQALYHIRPRERLANVSFR